MTETEQHWKDRLKATLAQELQADPSLRERLERILVDSPVADTTLARWMPRRS